MPDLFSQAIMMSGSALRKGTTGLMFDDDPENPSDRLSINLNCREWTNKTELNETCPFAKFVVTVTDEKLITQHKAELECLQSKSTKEIAVHWYISITFNYELRMYSI